MKQLLLLLICQLSLNFSFAQYFTGELHYRKTVIPKNNSIDLDSLNRHQIGTSMVYLITEGYYRSTYFRDGKMTYAYTYHDDTKLMYDETAGKPYLTYRDSRKRNVDSVRYHIYRDSTTIVQGYNCYMIVSEYPGYVIKSYYSDKLRINPEPFQGHEVGDWYGLLLQSKGGIGLKSITEYQGHTEMLEVVKVIPRKVAKSEFALPKGLPVVASFEVLDKQVALNDPTQEAINCYQQKFADIRTVGDGTQQYRSFVRFLLSEKGEPQHFTAYEEDEYGFYKIAIDIVRNCGFTFAPGEIGGKPVSSEVYFPVDFQF